MSSDPPHEHDVNVSDTVSLADLVEIALEHQSIEIFASHAAGAWERETKPVRIYRRTLYSRLQNDTTIVSSQIDEALRSQLQAGGFQFGLIRYSQKRGCHVNGLRDGRLVVYRWRPHTYHPSCGELVMYNSNHTRRHCDGGYEVEFLKLG